MIHRIFVYQWQRKLVTLLTAFLVWTFVSHTITATKIVPSVPVRLINMPADKTVQGLLSNGFLLKRMTLTLTGSKDVIEQIEPGDLEVIIDASAFPNETAIQVTKKNLISLNPDLNLSKHINSVSNPEFVLKMSPLVTEQIPIRIKQPLGIAPEGFEYLDIWPALLFQTVSGPDEDIYELKERGIDLTLNLDEISKEQLDMLAEKNPSKDEIHFFIPEAWKKVTIPILAKHPISINDQDERLMQINFLKKGRISLKNGLPVRVFYPLKYSKEVSPEKYPLKYASPIENENGIALLKESLFALGVSKIFMEAVKDYLEIQIVALPQTETEKLPWSIGFVAEDMLIAKYVASEMSLDKLSHSPNALKESEHEELLKKRFEFYKQNLILYLKQEIPLELESRLESDFIVITTSSFNEKKTDAS